MTTEYESLRYQHSKLQERYDELKRELQAKERKLEVEVPNSFRELEVASQQNENLMREIEHLKTELKLKEDELKHMKRAYKQEVSLSQKKLRDVTARLGGYDGSEQVIHHYLFLVCDRSIFNQYSTRSKTLKSEETRF